MRADHSFQIIEVEGIPLPQYGYPDKCRYCGCNLNRYNPFNSCNPCQERGMLGFPRDLRKEATEDAAILEKALEKIRSGKDS